MIEKLLISLLAGFEGTGLNTSRIIVALTLSFILGIYICLVYRACAQNNFYSKNFNATLALITPIMAAMVLTMQSSLIISLSSIGALSIIRFRTPIKDPMDLLYLFWAIGSGIMCGAGVYEVVLWSTLMVSFGLVFLNAFPHRKDSYVLVINGSGDYSQDNIDAVLQKESRRYKIRSKSITQAQFDIVYEIRTTHSEQLLTQLKQLPAIESVSLITQESEIGE